MGSVGRDDDLVIIDGTADFNSGQTFRMAITLSAITLKPVRINNIWAAKEPVNKRGMTAPLVEIVSWFTTNTEAQVHGNEVGSSTLEFRPKYRGTFEKINKAIRLSSGSMAASAVLTFQAIFPFLLMIGGNPRGDKLFDVGIDGATNCPDAPSFEYLDQVFLPAIRSYFGIEVICKLLRRGWGQMTPGTVRKGEIRIKFRPLEVGSTIKPREDIKMCEPDGESLDTYVLKVVINIITPLAMHDLLGDSLKADIESRFGEEVDIEYKTVEDSGHSDRVYVLLVAHSENCRWARDVINSEPLKGRDLESFTKQLSSQLCKDLEDEVSAASGGECPVDQFLQDQLVIFQALAKGRTCFPRQSKDQVPDYAIKHLQSEFPLVRDNLTLPNSPQEVVLSNVREGIDARQNDSMHTLLARYMAATMLQPKVSFYNEGKICIGTAMKVGEGVKPEGSRQALEPQA